MAIKGENMKHRLFTQYAALFLLFVGATLNGLAQSREVKQTAPFNPGGDLRVSTDRSRVRLTSWERNEVEVFARISRPEHGDNDFDPRAIEMTKIDVIGDARNLTIRTNFEDVPDRDGRWSGRSLPDVYLEIRAPRSLNLNLDADRGEVELRSFEGRLQVSTDRSTVKAEDLTGQLRLRMDRGTATVATVRAQLNFQGDRTNAKFTGAQLTGDSQLEVDRSEVELSVPRAQGLYVSANRGKSANFESDFAISSSSFSDDRVEGEINGGGPRLTIRTDRGKARLRQQ
jgi:hypothetical protein